MNWVIEYLWSSMVVQRSTVLNQRLLRFGMDRIELLRRGPIDAEQLSEFAKCRGRYSERYNAAGAGSASFALRAANPPC